MATNATILVLVQVDVQIVKPIGAMRVARLGATVHGGVAVHLLVLNV